MGFFSWLTSDTEKSIANHYSTRSTFPVHMVTEDGQIFTENNYEGYGVFGGKDIHVLAAEMNGYKGDTDEETRMLFFDKIWIRGIKKGDKKYCHREDFENYQSPIESEGGLCANELVAEHGWESFGDSGEFEGWAEQGLKMPKLVERLPNTNSDWKQWWDSLPYPESCGHQGFFYDDEEDECDECGRIMDGGECEYCDRMDEDIDEDE
jgi:hypothetical protein